MLGLDEIEELGEIEVVIEELGLIVELCVVEVVILDDVLPEGLLDGVDEALTVILDDELVVDVIVVL